MTAKEERVIFFLQCGSCMLPRLFGFSHTHEPSDSMSWIQELMKTNEDMKVGMKD